MGSAASTRHSHPSTEKFSLSVDRRKSGDSKRNSEINDNLEKEALRYFKDCVANRNEALDFQTMKGDDTRSADVTRVRRSTRSPPDKPIVDEFDDSTYHKSWLSECEAAALFSHLKAVGEEQRPRNSSEVPTPVTMKYPLWALYYGIKRQKDKAIALDRWGSYHESWLRVEEPSEEIADCCKKLRRAFGLSSSSVNSIVVNYYFDGDTTYIPAHRDTVACLEDDSSVYCLSLGATRSFVLTSNESSGQYQRDKMDIEKEWRVGNGDLYALGPRTNENYCHAVPIEPALKSMRISVIFRTVSKSFVDFDGPLRSVCYANGKTKEFTAECLTTTGFDDAGVREHVADLIMRRETDKKMRIRMAEENILEMARAEAQRKTIYSAENRIHAVRLENRRARIGSTIGIGVNSSAAIMKQLAMEDDTKYYMGRGMTVPSAMLVC